MADAGLDLKNPGGKEMVVVGGGALLLALIYFALHKTTPSTGTPAPAGTGTSGSGGMRAAGGPFTGNALTDANVANPVIPSTTGTGTTGGPTGPPAKIKLPVAHATQGAQEILGSGGGGSGGGGVFLPSSGGTGGGGGPVSTTAAGVYNALVKAGLLPYQAAGVLGNIQNESTFNPEAIGDQGTSFGLIQWHNTSYPGAAGYVTGNVAKDFNNQIKAIVTLFKQHGIGGTTAAAVAGNWAAQIEGCVGCQPGGAQYSGRVANAQNIWQAVMAGKFNPPKPPPKVVSTGGYNNFPGGLAAWRKLFAQGTKAASAGTVAGLFPKATPAANRTPVRKPKPKPKPFAVNRSIAAIVANVFGPRKPPPKPAASKPVSIKGAGIRKQYFA